MRNKAAQKEGAKINSHFLLQLLAKSFLLDTALGPHIKCSSINDEANYIIDTQFSACTIQVKQNSSWFLHIHQKEKNLKNNQFLIRNFSYFYDDKIVFRASFMYGYLNRKPNSLALVGSTFCPSKTCEKGHKQYDELLVLVLFLYRRKRLNEEQVTRCDLRPIFLSCSVLKHFLCLVFFFMNKHQPLERRKQSNFFTDEYTTQGSKYLPR